MNAMPRNASSAALMPCAIAVWVAALIVVPAPLAARIFLLAPLVIVPHLIPHLPPDRRWIGRVGGWPSFMAALPLVLAYSVPTGPLAAVATLPWLTVAVIGLLAGLRHGFVEVPSIVRPVRLPDLGVDVALGFWAVGAVFTTVDRSGVDAGFSPVIVLLTATHFHFAGFALLGMASLLAVSRRRLAASVAGLVVGIPLTALGFVMDTDAINALGAILVGSAGIGVGLALLTGPMYAASAWVRRAAGVALLVGMPMGIAWSVAALTDWRFLDLEMMVRTHGALNSTAVLLAVLAYRPLRPSVGWARESAPGAGRELVGESGHDRVEPWPLEVRVEPPQDEPRGLELGHRPGPVDLRPDTGDAVRPEPDVDGSSTAHADLREALVEESLRAIDRHGSAPRGR
jgi:hypothetical protein